MMFDQRRWLFGLVLFLLVLFSHFSMAHARFTPTGNVPGRSANAGLKNGPCGGVPRGSAPKVLTSGSQVRIDWQETVNHPGYFEFYFSPSGDANFVKLITVQDTQNGTTDLPHSYSVNLNMPTGECTACTLQMVQVMTENPAAPTNYYSCADIELTSAPTPSPTPTPVPTPVPAPVPGPTPGPTPGPETCH